jgi:hypothetical protein
MAEKSMSIATNKPFPLTFLRACFWLVAIVLGLLHTWAGASSRSMNPDGIAYLDMGDAYLRGDWNMAINPYWSPLYSWLLAPVIYVFHPSMRWEFPVVHIVNFLIYLLALICFEFFWLRLMRWQQANSSEAEIATFPGWAWLSLGYTLFLYSALNLIKIWSVTPDMLVAALVFLAAGLIVRIRAGAATWRTFALLGCVLGMGYLAKTAMFLLAFVFLGISFFSVGDLRRASKLVPVGLFGFLLIAGPYVAALSNAKGSLTYGDTGKLMYAWHVNSVPHPHWQGEVPGAGIPRHPSIKIFESPPIYKFSGPVGGTYPISYNPVYWYEGITPRLELKGQVKVLVDALDYYFDLFFRQQGGLLVTLIFLYFFMIRSKNLPKLVRDSGLAIVALLALGMYALVHVQPRYIGAFVVLFWAELVAAVRLPNSREAHRLLAFAGAVMLSVNLINIAAFNFDGFRKLIGLPRPNPLNSATKAGARTWAGEVAEELHRLGIESGDKIAVIGYAFTSFWARLARVQIVAEMFDWEADPFWLGGPAAQAEVLKAFAGSGARAIVAERVPLHVTPSGWHRVGSSNYYIYLFNVNRRSKPGLAAF